MPGYRRHHQLCLFLHFGLVLYGCKDVFHSGINGMPWVSQAFIPIAHGPKGIVGLLGSSPHSLGQSLAAGLAHMSVLNQTAGTVVSVIGELSAKDSVGQRRCQVDKEQ